MNLATKAILATVGAAVGIGIIMAVARKGPGANTEPDDSDDGGDDAPSGGNMGGKFENQDKAIAVGEIGDPSVAPLVAEIQALWDSKGIPRDLIVPAQFYTMSKATHTDGPDPDEEPGPILAIASRATWEHTANFLHDVVVPLFAEIKRRGGKRSDYRTGGFREGYGDDGHGHDSYNDVTGGADASRHVDGDALDIIPLRHVAANTDILLMSIATMMLTHPSLPIGGGFYAGNGHIDVGGKRHWSGKTVKGKADEYIARAKKELAIS